MSEPHVFLHLLVSGQHYDTIERYAPELGHFYEFARRALPAAWTIEKRGIWFVCQPPQQPIPSQGWKIHLSARLQDAAPLLSSAVRILLKRRLHFKFALDRTILQLLSAKQWSRGGAGKFITIYPPTLEEFKIVIEELYRELCGYHGPYVLSDRRYKDSSVVYYRYGGFVRRSAVDFRGESTPVITAPDGTDMPDQRLPYFSPPIGIEDPVSPSVGDTADADAGHTLADGRYAVNRALGFSVAGGIYLATDRATDQTVLVKEARPFTGDRPNGTDAVALLKKEYRVLTLLRDAAVGPRPVDFFCDWEHYYLVEEYLAGSTLRHFTASRGPAIRRRLSRTDQETFLKWYGRLYAEIAETLQRIHDHGVSFGDISHHNIIVFGEAESVRFIDFEGAHEAGVDNPTPLFTPGFAPAKREVLFENDFFGLGALMLSGLMPVNGMLQLDRAAPKRFLAALKEDLGIPGVVTDTIVALMSDEPADRPTPRTAAERLRACTIPEYGPLLGQHGDIEDLSLERLQAASLAQSTIDYVAQTATYDRDDRLFPSDPALFATNALNVAYGASGVIHAIRSVRGTVPDEMAQWLSARAGRRRAETPPGLYTGKAGTAWVLWDLGLGDRAIEAGLVGEGSPGMRHGADLFYGLSGWGLLQLRLLSLTQESCYLDNAVAAGEDLVASVNSDTTGCWWAPVKGETYYGLGQGSSGAALFLIYLHIATGHRRFLDVARRALEWELAKGIRMPDGGMTWPIHSNTRSVVPYWRYGSAGIGIVLLRYLAVEAHERFRAALLDIIAEADKKYTVYPSLFFGLAGLGEFLLDVLQFMPEHVPAAERALRKILAGIRLFAIDKPEGTAFPGEGLVRISCDYGTGCAGIATFLNRFACMKPSSFMLDSFLTGDDRYRNRSESAAIANAR